MKVLIPIVAETNDTERSVAFPGWGKGDHAVVDEVFAFGRLPLRGSHIVLHFA